MIMLRDEVLRKPLGLNFTEEQLAAEKDQIHLAAMMDERVIGTLLIAPQEGGHAKLRQMAISPNAQGQGVGAALLAFAENWLREHGYSHISLHARQGAEAFYARHGYATVGEPFEEVTIPHVTMEKTL